MSNLNEKFNIPPQGDKSLDPAEVGVSPEDVQVDAERWQIRKVIQKFEKGDDLSREEITLLAKGYKDEARKSDQFKAEKESANAIAVKDKLTGVLNRRGFEEQWEIFRRERSRDVEKKPFTVAAFDLDGFKAINDTFHHAAGDFALTCVAQVIEEAIRAGDIFARVGGDEFVLVLPNTDETSGEEVVQRVFRAITDEASRRIKEKYPKSKGVSASIGMITEGPHTTHGVSEDQLVHVADTIANTVKLAGKRGVLNLKDYRELIDYK